MVIATSASTPPSLRSPTRTSFTSNGSDDDYISVDETDSSILNSSPIRRIKSVDNQKDELAYCNNLACILSKATDLPKLCQGFPSVVQTVGGGLLPSDEDRKIQKQQQLYRPSSTESMVNMMNYGGYSTNDGFVLPPPSDR